MVFSGISRLFSNHRALLPACISLGSKAVAEAVVLLPGAVYSQSLRSYTHTTTFLALTSLPTLNPHFFKNKQLVLITAIGYSITGAIEYINFAARGGLFLKESMPFEFDSLSNITYIGTTALYQISLLCSATSLYQLSQELFRRISR